MKTSEIKVAQNEAIQLRERLRKAGWKDHLKALKLMDRRSQLLVAGALDICDNSDINLLKPDERRGIAVAVRSIPFIDAQALKDVLEKDGAFFKELHPLWLLKVLPNMPAAHLSILTHSKGPCHTACGDRGGLAVFEQACIELDAGFADTMIYAHVFTRQDIEHVICCVLQKGSGFDAIPNSEESLCRLLNC
ncbi:MAG: hypothetical protein AAF984_03250 [Verrucomicrobiota bacterium]